MTHVKVAEGLGACAASISVIIEVHSKGLTRPAWRESPLCQNVKWYMCWRSAKPAWQVPTGLHSVVRQIMHAQLDVDKLVQFQQVARGTLAHLRLHLHISSMLVYSIACTRAPKESSTGWEQFCVGIEDIVANAHRV